MTEQSVELMKLYLTNFAVDEVLGIYGQNKDTLAARMRYLHPAAAVAFKAMNADKIVRCSDMLRTPEGSLLNRKNKGSGLRPGWSGHNFGFSIDIETGWMYKTHGFKSKLELDEWMMSFGWWCHNPPGDTRDWEAWHYNYFGPEAEHFLSYRDEGKASTWMLPVAYKISEYYGHWWKQASNETVQLALQAASLYQGDIDGKLGPLSEQAIRAFQRAWLLDEDGVAGPITKRTLMLSTAEKVLVNAPC
jgi:hypothetical protein